MQNWSLHFSSNIKHNTGWGGYLKETGYLISIKALSTTKSKIAYIVSRKLLNILNTKERCWMNITHVCLTRTSYYLTISITIMQTHYRQSKNIPISWQTKDYVQAQLNIPHSYLQKISEFANNGRFVGRLKI